MKKIAFTACAALLVGLTGCSTFSGSSLTAPLVRDDAKMEDFTNIEPGELKAVRKHADQYVSLFLKAIAENDYNKISPFLAPPLKKQMTEQGFKAMSERLKAASGSPARMQHFGELKQGLFSTSVYKVEMKKKTKKSSVMNEALIRLSIGKLDGEYLIWNVVFD